MPIPASQRVTVYGTLFQDSSAGVEIFDFGWSVMPGMGDAALAQALAPALVTAWHISGVEIYGDAGLQGVRVETIAEGGTVESSYNQPTASQPIGLNINSWPTFTCMAVTFETDAVDAKGRKVRGRCYPPACASPVVGSSIAPTYRDAYAAAWATFFTNMVTAGSPLAVASTTSAGLTEVTGISVDNIVDSQRSRRNHLTSARSSVHAI